MIGIVKSILGIFGPIIDRLIEWWDKEQRRIEYEKRQDKRDQVDNPGDAFADHFGGRRVSNVPEDAHETNETGPDDRDTT